MTLRWTLTATDTVQSHWSAVTLQCSSRPTVLTCTNQSATAPHTHHVVTHSGQPAVRCLITSLISSINIEILVVVRSLDVSTHTLTHALAVARLAAPTNTQLSHLITLRTTHTANWILIECHVISWHKETRQEAQLPQRKACI